MSAQSHKEVVIVKIIRSIDGLTSIEDAIGYADERLLIDIGDDEFVSKRMLGSVVQGSDKFYAAGTTLPITMINVLDFTTNSLRPIVNLVRALDETTDTNDGVTPAVVQYVFTDDTKSELASIIIPDNGVGALDYDTWVRVV